MVEVTLAGISLIGNMLTSPVAQSIHIYIQTRVILASIFVLVGRLVGYGNICGACGRYILALVGLRCWSYVTFFICLISVSVGVGLIIYHSLIVTFFGKVPEITGSVIRCNLTKYFSRRGNRVDKRYYFYCWWRAQPTIGVPCGSFFIIGRHFTMAYLKELANNFTPAMLLIQPSVMQIMQGT